jgi:RNA polymerase sigma-70 factor (ECF subfamily)
MEYMKVTQTEDKTIEELVAPSSELEDSGLDQGTENEGISGITNPYPQNAKSCDNVDEQVLQDLICRILSQDQAAFTALFKAMSVRIHSIALRITGNVQLAEEVTEDTFFQIWRQAPRFDPSRGTAKTWILTIARSRALDARRSMPPFDNLTEYETDANINIQKQDDLPDLLSAIEHNQMLHSALNRLEPVPRQLIALAFFKGLSHEEIANHAELPLGTVKSHLRRAIIHLREALTTTTQIPVIKL